MTYDDDMFDFFAQEGMRMMDEEQEQYASPADERKFLSDEELQRWWREMQQKHPSIYLPDDLLFGRDRTQHALGTKIMTYFDDDPNRPMRFTIRGSRWVRESSSPWGGSGSSEKTPMYVVKLWHGSNNELDQIELGSVHEEGGWKVGWDIEEEEDDEKDSVDDNEVEDDEDDDKEDEHAHTNKIGLEQWCLETDGPIADAFLHWTFASGNEIIGGTDADPEKDAHCLLMRIVRAHVVDGMGGVILQNTRETKFQAIEFNCPLKSHNGAPLIHISYAIGPDKEGAQYFLRGEDLSILKCTDKCSVQLEQHILSTCKGEGSNDVGSGLLLYEGYLKPMPNPTHKMEPNPHAIMIPKQMVDECFGVELELSCAIGMDRWNLAHSLSKETGVSVENREPHPMMRYSKAGEAKGGGRMRRPNKHNAVDTNSVWKLVSDRSIEASDHLPSSRTFELVSPILSGEAGLTECAQMVKALTDISAIQVNKSMGFHVHINVKDLTMEELVQACHTFVQYERVMDTFMPPSRRTGSTESNNYFQSHQTICLESLEACRTLDQLCDVMNPNKGRYYKLNLQNLKTGRQPTLEFRQHPTTSDADLVLSWVRLCMSLVYNTAKLLPPSFSSSLSADVESDQDKFETLFESIIQDPALKEIFAKRREQVKES
eukprot:scaffold47334_cov43-Attheya_sp.AAC.1